MSSRVVMAADGPELLARPFDVIADQIRRFAALQPDRPALIHRDDSLSYAGLDRLMDRVAAALQRDGLRPGETVAICAATSIPYAATYMGILRAGAVVAPLAPSSTPDGLAKMIADCGARVIFGDATTAALLADAGVAADDVIALDGKERAFEAWLEPAGVTPAPAAIDPSAAFNIIYSSGTTGTPKGIVQSHQMRWAHVKRGVAFGYREAAVTLISTPLYSNTTLVSFLPSLALGASVVLMEKFAVRPFLELAQKHRVTHAMLVPVQYRRLLETPDFDAFDLSSFELKTCTSAPFPAALKAEVLARWPGGLSEVYGMTEGGGTCLLDAHVDRDKLHTVGRPAAGHDIRLIDPDGCEVAAGGAGEIVGRSPSMMTGYHNLPDKTAEAEWRSPQGERFIRTGDIGRFDPDGFLVLMDRAKDMIISGGFNIYPSDLEAVLVRHAHVAEAAVIGVPSDDWGETPVAFVTARPGTTPDPQGIREWVNGQVGKTQRLADLRILPTLPRSAIGKVLKRDLRDQYTTGHASA